MRFPADSRQETGNFPSARRGVSDQGGDLQARVPAGVPPGLPSQMGKIPPKWEGHRRGDVVYMALHMNTESMYDRRVCRRSPAAGERRARRGAPQDSG